MAECQGRFEDEVPGDMASGAPGEGQAGQHSVVTGEGSEGEGGCPRDKLEEEVHGWEEEGEEGEEEEDTSDTTGDEEEVDPRIAENLEIMNQSCAEVNRLENELDEARSKYRSTFQTSSQRMEAVGAKIKKSIQRARPYFDLTNKAKQAQDEALRAARLYKSATSTYRAAIEMVTLAEKGLDDNTSNSKARTLSSAYQETLGHAMEKVTEAEREKTRSEIEHNKKAAICAEMETQIHFLEKKYKRSIAKARPYFETKAELEVKLQQLKQHVWDLQQTISSRKARYSDALHQLEAVSTEIHESRRRRKKMLLQFPREPGVGAETDSLGSSISEANIERGIFSSTASFPDEDDEDDESDDVGELFKQKAEGTSVSSQASDRVFSRSVSSTSVFSSEGHSDSASESPGSPPAVAFVPHSPLAQRLSASPPAPPSSLMDLARGDLGPPVREGQSASASPRDRNGGDLTVAVPQPTDESQTTQNSEFPFAGCPREAGDGSAQDDCPGEESSARDPDSQSSLCSQFSSALPPHQGGGLQSPEPPLKAAEIPGAGVETGQRSDPPREEVQKTPLRRTDATAHRPLQGVMLLNPSDLPASPFYFGPRR